MIRTSILTTLLAGAVASFAAEPIITLDLTKAVTELNFDNDSGRWTETFNEDEECIESQNFIFLHGAIEEWQTWWGFTASNSHDNVRRTNTLAYQWSNMAEGGIELNADGSVKVDENGTPVVNPEVPYLVGYSSEMFGPHSTAIIFNDGKNYNPVGVYVNLNSYPYYCIEYGDSFARAFRNGDHFKLFINGVAPDGTEKKVEAKLASYTNGDLTINRGWKYVDLAPLGTVNEIYFTMETTDVGAYGANTPCYFCLDKLQVKPADGAAVNTLCDNNEGLSYDRATKTVNLGSADFATLYDAAGRKVLSSDASFSLESLPVGVYVVRTAKSSLKIAK